MKSNLICMLITIIAYLILMIVVGILASKKNKDNYHDQCNGHNNALEQVGCAGSQKSADAGIGNDDYST